MLKDDEKILAGINKAVMDPKKDKVLMMSSKLQSNLKSNKL